MKRAFVFSLVLCGLSDLIQAAPLAPAVNALPVNGQVVAGNASISQTQTPSTASMNVNQSSQRAVINWDSFNVGRNASVNFNQPNSSAVTLNRVTGTSQSMIDGAIRANGQVIFVNPNGVTFGRGAEVNAAGVVASTMNIADKDFMDGKLTFKGNGTGAVINEGKMITNADGGYIALLAPEVRNDGYLIAKKGSGTIAMAAGEQITLNFMSNSLVSIKVDASTYNGLIENKRVVEVNGGLVVVAAGAANQLISSVIRNTGRISASSAINNGGVIELVANTITQAGKVSANSKAAEGGQINIVGSDITLASNSKTSATGSSGGGQINIGLANTAVTGGVQVNSQASNPTQAARIVQLNADEAASNKQLAKFVNIEQDALVNTSATQVGNGGSIAIWSEIKTTVAGILKSMGGSLGGNGGFIETSSKTQVSLAPTVSINTSANNSSGVAGTWLLDPIVDLMIDSPTANAISSALSTNNVTIAVTANTTACSLGIICISNGSGIILIDSGVNILKSGTNYTTLTFSTVGNFMLNGSIAGQNLDVIIQSSIAYLGVGSSIQASKVTIQAQTVFARGSIDANNYLFSGGAGSLGNAIELLAQSIFITGVLRLNGSLPPFPITAPAPVDLNSSTYNADLSLNKIFSSTAANDPAALVVNSSTQAASNVIYLTATSLTASDYAIIGLEPSAEVYANGTTGGSIFLRSTDSIYMRAGSMLQANGSSGAGGMIGMKATDIALAGEVIAGGSTDGGSITFIAESGQLDLRSSHINSNGGTGTAGYINAQISNISALTADISSVGMPSSGFDLSNVLFLRQSVSSATVGSINLAYEIIDSTGSRVTLGAGSYANLSITGTPTYFNDVNTITNSVGTGSYPNLMVKGLTLTGADAGHFMLVSIPHALTVTAAQSKTSATQALIAATPPPPPPPPPAVFSRPAAPPPAVEPMVAPAPRATPNEPPSAVGGELRPTPDSKSAPLSVTADGSIQLTPPAPPNTPAEPPPPPAASPPPANRPPSSVRESANKENLGNRDGNSNSPESKKYGANKDGVDKTDAKEGSEKSNAGKPKYVSKYANGFRNGDKSDSKERGTKVVAGAKPNNPREGKYSNRINALNNNPAAMAAMKQNPFASNISPFPPGVATEVMPPPILRGGDSLAQSYDDVPSIRNSGVANVGRSRKTENYYESLESVNLMSTLNLFIIH